MNKDIKEQTSVLSETKTNTQKAMRQIIIETDGSIIDLIKAEVSGSIELVAILQEIIGQIRNQQANEANKKLQENAAKNKK